METSSKLQTMKTTEITDTI